MGVDIMFKSLIFNYQKLKIKVHSINISFFNLFLNFKNWACFLIISMPLFLNIKSKGKMRLEKWDK